MKSRRLLTLVGLLLIVALTVYVAAFGLGTDKVGISSVKDDMKLGLDIQGGVVIEYEAVIPEDIADDEDEIARQLDGTAAVMSTRIDSKGLMEPRVTINYSQRRIRVEMPGVTDVNEAAKFIGTTAKLTFHKVAETTVLQAADIDARTIRVGDFEGEEIMDGSSVKDSGSRFSSTTSYVGYVVDLVLDSDGSAAFEAASKEFVNRASGKGQIAIAVDDVVISAPWASQVLTGGQFYISNMEQQEANDLSLQIKSGALPLKLEEIETNLIGATLGQDALDSSVNAAIIGFILVVLFMIIVYRIPGVVASIALALYAAIILFTMTALQATLTLPGVVGIVLGFGMAVDANVVIFERIKEELNNGKTVRAAVKYGFKRAMRTILDANITTLIAAVVLYTFGDGPIKGFATTLGIGIIASMFTAVVFTRTLLVNLEASGLFTNPKFFGASSNIKEKIRNILNHYKVWFAISAAVILIGGGMFTVKGMNLGIDFQGGTEIQYYLKTDFDTADVKDALSSFEKDGVALDAVYLKAGIGETADKELIIRTVSSLNTTDRATIEELLLKAYPNAEFRRVNQFSPSVGDEIKTKAVLSVLIAAVGMLIYITFRFEIVFGIASIIALLHDVLVLLAVYAIFQIPVNTAFIAAILTVVGYSINDTIVVFDRIRENIKFEKKPDYFEVANRSLNQTIIRSINTSLTTLLVIGSLYFLGIDSIKDLALPLMAGVIAGTYSSIFIASPIWALWRKHRSDKSKHYTGN
ncbi:MAG: protein translocase subunit SecD [Clostridia bacterium]|nr:protein translocase subunit SecD [Clostridia bacterium]